MIRPTTVPQSLEELIIEQAIAREALRLSFIQHKNFATSLKGVQSDRTISDAFEQSSSGMSLVNMMELDLLVGSGGVLSHAPRRQQSARMLVDSFMPEGITQLAVDSIPCIKDIFGSHCNSFLAKFMSGNLLTGSSGGRGLKQKSILGLTLSFINSAISKIVYSSGLPIFIGILY